MCVACVKVLWKWAVCVGSARLIKKGPGFSFETGGPPTLLEAPPSFPKSIEKTLHATLHYRYEVSELLT